jgi:hypothetical protein
MNLIENIMEMISGSNLNRLSSLLGQSEDNTRSAVGAAVPAILAGVSRLVSSGDGAQRVAAKLSSFSGSPGDFLAQEPQAVESQGHSALTDLFGSGGVSGMINTLARYSGFSAETASKLLGYVAPFVLGGVAKQFAGKSLSIQSLTNLFASQKNAIASALPSGLSLPDMPTISAAGTTAYTARDVKQPRTGSRRLAPYLWTVGGLAAAFLLYQAWSQYRPRSATAELAQSPPASEVTGAFERQITTLTNTLNGIRDSDSVQAALPGLRNVGRQVADTKATFDRLPDAGKAEVRTALKPALTRLEDVWARVRSSFAEDNPIAPIVENVMAKLRTL